jgi:DNA-binding NarL/FixJ family response regulator
MGGMDTIRELKALDPSFKAVIASGYANSQVMAEYKRYGFQEVICKPYRPEEVNKILLNLLK